MNSYESRQDIGSLRGEIDQKYKQMLHDKSQVLDYIYPILRNFAHRYLATQYMPDAQISILENTLVCKVVEKDMKQALKDNPKEVREELVEVIKKIGISKNEENNPSLMYCVQVECLDWNEEGKGRFIIESLISWDHPEHNNSNKTHFKKWDFYCADISEFRLELPSLFEREVFPFFNN